MGLYKRVAIDGTQDSLNLVAGASSYTLYQRGSTWYVNFRASGRQLRLSTGMSDLDEARALIESFRGDGFLSPFRRVDDKHLYRMIERARYKHRNKQTPFALSISLLREVAERCRGYCEVTGHRLEDEGPFRPSLDRIVPALGYVPGNIRITCLIANTGMLHYGEAAFGEIAIAYCRRVGLIPDPATPASR